MSLTGRLIHFALPLVKLRSRLRGLTVGARGLVYDDVGRLLLVRHSYLPAWHLPGGGVEFGETAVDALRRELAEEGGVELTGEPRLVGVYHNPEWTSGDHVVLFEAAAWTPCPRRWGVEIETAEFFAPDALPADVHASVRRRLDERDGARRSTLW